MVACASASTGGARRNPVGQVQGLPAGELRQGPEHEHLFFRPPGEPCRRPQVRHRGSRIAVRIEADASHETAEWPAADGFRPWSPARAAAGRRARRWWASRRAPARRLRRSPGCRVRGADRRTGSVLASPISGSRPISRTRASAPVAVASRILTVRARPIGSAIMWDNAAAVVLRLRLFDIVGAGQEQVEHGGDIRRRADDAKRLERLHAESARG